MSTTTYGCRPANAELVTRGHGESVLALLAAFEGMSDEALAWDGPGRGGDGASLLLTVALRPGCEHGS